MLCLLLASCLPPTGGQTPPPSPPRESWAEALRALDPPDAPTPAYDLTAAYLRLQGENLQIRVDLLAFQNADDLSLDIGIGDKSHPETDPRLIHIPAAVDSARIVLDPGLATVIAEIPRSQIPARPRVDVTTPQDALTGLTLDGLVPAQTTPLLLTFYDTFGGRFPAEALRRWDGAHSGPRGERHGLKHLLDAVEIHRIPIVLLDLKTPENLSALDAMGLLPRIQHMEADGLLLLPDQPGQEISPFGLPPSPFVYAETRPGAFLFTSISDTRHLYRPLFSSTAILPMAIETDESQPTPHGPSLAIRRAALETALNEDPTDLLVLGGSLQKTTWGSPEMASETLAWFASRPYIRVLSATDLLDFTPQTGQPNILPLPHDQALAQLEAHYHRLTQPVLQFAAHWQGEPLSTCAIDLDEDNASECVLANSHYLAILDPRGARLTYLFSMTQMEDSQRVQQLIGPSWQVAVGLSASSRWDLSKGEAADPGAYPGAFTDPQNPFEAYQPVIEEHTLIFTSISGSHTKTFTLTETSLSVSYSGQAAEKTQIPLLVEPEARFTPGWAGKYVRETCPNGIAWGLSDGPLVRIQTQGQITMRAFDEALPFLTAPEDPDFSYPPGHFVPFPMALVEVEIQPNAVIAVDMLCP
ncbi:MAG: hypothetical protein Fur0043_23430 [Anaerolineales bacterium]